ncbi:hypothetical protein [Nocardia amikacinitolerans]|uniref:hypothetical protein n=1 Tax=Nocardia amikacinitolerans TaxID=756689 RepID=UPI0012ECFD09|nr:hypothetical protein [Nocardia amikacinitolerans]
MTNQATGTGYTAGGKVLTGKALEENQYEGYIFLAANTTWTAVTTAFRYAVLYDDTATGKPLIAALDFLTTQTVTAQDLTLRWEFEGLSHETGETDTLPGLLVMRF